MSLVDRPALARLVVYFALTGAACAPCAAAQTQAEMTGDACAQYKKADQALNATYSKVLKDHAKDAQFVAKLKQAQRAWIAFRDAHLAARFPKADKQAEYGSSYPMCRCAVLAELTAQREKELKLWADGIPEGDVCNGSVKAARVDDEVRRRNGASSGAVEEPMQKQKANASR
jgi:uncharacterized protein YecT (DUF1311 family)